MCCRRLHARPARRGGKGEGFEALGTHVVNLNDDGYLRMPRGYGLGELADFYHERHNLDPGRLFSRHLDDINMGLNGPIDFPLPQPFRLLAKDLPKGLGDYIARASATVVSDRFKALLEEFGARDLQWFPVEVEAAQEADAAKPGGGKLIERGYWYLNPMRRLDLVDQAASDIVDDPWPGAPPLEVRDFIRWRKLALRELPSDEHYFRIKRIPPYQFISPALDRAIRERRLLVNIYAMALKPDEWTSTRRDAVSYRPQYQS
jgi:hypothetical protein